MNVLTYLIDISPGEYADLLFAATVGRRAGNSSPPPLEIPDRPVQNPGHRVGREDVQHGHLHISGDQRREALGHRSFASTRTRASSGALRGRR